MIKDTRSDEELKEAFKEIGVRIRGSQSIGETRLTLEQGKLWNEIRQRRNVKDILENFEANGHDYFRSLPVEKMVADYDTKVEFVFYDRDEDGSLINPLEKSFTVTGNSGLKDLKDRLENNKMIDLG